MSKKNLFNIDNLSVKDIDENAIHCATSASLSNVQVVQNWW